MNDIKQIKNLSYSALTDRYPVLEVCSSQILVAINEIARAFGNGGKLITMGNGGSSADAEHIGGELLKGFVLPRKLKGKIADELSQVDPLLVDNLQGSLPAISLGVNHSVISAFNNDMNPDYVYAQMLLGLAQKEDIVWCISTSGNSKNIIEGLKVCKAKGVRTIALTGEKPSLAMELADICIQAPASDTHHVQELHLPIYHAICLEIEKIFFE